ncbi:MAG: tetratricopeptide repeat protein, partial [Isosphaeraceae bacterium]
MFIMIRHGVTLAALAGCAVLAGAARADDWKAEHDAGWNAYKEGRLEAAEKHLLSAEKVARASGENDPRLATTLDH